MTDGAVRAELGDECAPADPQPPRVSSGAPRAPHGSRRPPQPQQAQAQLAAPWSRADAPAGLRTGTSRRHCPQAAAPRACHAEDLPALRRPAAPRQPYRCALHYKPLSSIELT